MKKESTSYRLNSLSVASMYVAAIMGAGFASGRELWQFFGVFGKAAFAGAVIIGTMYIVFGMIISYIARRLNTSELGSIVVPAGHRRLVAFTRYFMALMLFSVLVTMSAAGGALFNQQLGLSRILGGAVVTVLVVVTVLGEFQRVSKVLRYVMPILTVVVIIMSLLIIFADLDETSQGQTPEPSPMAPNWLLAACLYTSVNILAMLPMVTSASIGAKNEKTAVSGACLGGAFLCILAFLLIAALQQDMEYSQAMDMPMLGYTARISPAVNGVYAVVLLIAVYSSATSGFFGFTTILPDGPRKKWLVIIFAALAFLLGLVGFKNVISYLFPAEGFIGFAIIAMILINFVLVFRKGRKRDGRIRNI